jgi:hypothetical protein
MVVFRFIAMIMIVEHAAFAPKTGGHFSAGQIVDVTIALICSRLGTFDNRLMA